MKVIKKYFTQDYIKFFKELESNNNKEWFNKNKTNYIKYVDEPFKLFVNRLLEVICKLDGTIRIDASEAIFRLNRDLRFSKDKSPYKVFKSALINTNGRNKAEPGFYLEIGATDIKISGGCFKLTPKQMKYIDNNMHLINPIISKRTFINYCGELRKTKNSLTFETLLSSELVTSEELDILILTHWQIMLPMVNVFKEILKQTVK